MKQTRLLMGMPITVEVLDKGVTEKIINQVFEYFQQVENRFSVFKRNSEISKINRGEIDENEYSKEMKTVFNLSEKTKKEANGFFDIFQSGRYDPSGLVKGWAIKNAAEILQKMGFKNYYVEAGGDIQVSGVNKNGEQWRVGIKNPFIQEQIVKVVSLKNQGIATSGTYLRGQHIYNPKSKKHGITEIVSLTIIGSDVYEADRFATAAFAMGKEGINFIENLQGFEGYLIDSQGVATKTSGFEKYEIN